MITSDNSKSPLVMPPGLSLLVAEDHDFQRRLIVETLRNLGAAEIHEAACGGEALEVLDRVEHAVDIIISDLDIPGMDGMELMRHLGESNCTASLIIASSMDRSLVRSVLSMAGAYNIHLLGAIGKPPAPETLVRLIASHDPARIARVQSRPKDLEFDLDEVRSGLEQVSSSRFSRPRSS